MFFGIWREIKLKTKHIKLKKKHYVWFTNCAMKSKTFFA